MSKKCLPILFDSQKSIQFVEVDGEFALTVDQIARGLGYADSSSVFKLYDRFRDELEPYKGSVKLSTPGGLQDVTIFTEEGIYLISMLARTPRAKEFRRKVAGLLKALRQRKLALIRRETATTLLMLQERLRRRKKDDTFLRRLIRYRQMGLSQWEVGLLLRCSRTTVREYEKLLKESGLWEVLPCRG